jgi:hypothetical protein
VTPQLAVEIALLARLLAQGWCVEAERSKSLIQRLQNARWVKRGRRQGEWLIRDGASDPILARLGTILPTWEADFELLRERGLDPSDPLAIRALPSYRARPTPGVRRFINRRNWNAAAGIGPKRTAREPPLGVELTHDWMIRLRWNVGLRVRIAERERLIEELSADGYECPLPERVFRRGLTFAGVAPETIFTCENLGAYIDLPLPDNAMALFAPGCDWRAAKTVLDLLPQSQWVHFGDLDPEGIEIARYLAKRTGRTSQFLVPSFALQRYADMAQRHGVEWRDVPDQPMLKMLAQSKRGLYQEVFMLDADLPGELKTHFRCS